MQNEEKNIKIWTGELPDGSYKLLDSGEKQKLEEIGGIKIVRAEPRAWWQKNDARIWNYELSKEKNFEKIIDIGIGEIKAKIKYKEGSKHIGIFPEQFPQWKWIENKLGARGGVRILNLFGYTGIASLVAASALSREASEKWEGEVTHVDASKQSVDWARENQKLSGMENAPIRWIVDDVVKFIKKEIKRGERYDAIIMDPPSYGKGPKGEVWKIEEKLPDLLSSCREILSDDPLFVIFNMYSTELSSISVANLLADMTKGLGGKIEMGELAIRPASAEASSGKQQNSERLLPLSIFALWQK